MHTQILLIGLIVTVSGCSHDPERSRVVPATDSPKASALDGGRAVTKDPRRIATH